jgi:hypothetical protein
MADPAIYGPAIVAALAWIAWHHYRFAPGAALKQA